MRRAVVIGGIKCQRSLITPTVPPVSFWRWCWLCIVGTRTTENVGDGQPFSAAMVPEKAFVHEGRWKPDACASQESVDKRIALCLPEGAVGAKFAVTNTADAAARVVERNKPNANNIQCGSASSGQQTDHRCHRQTALA